MIGTASLLIYPLQDSISVSNNTEKIVYQAKCMVINLTSFKKIYFFYLFHRERER